MIRSKTFYGKGKQHYKTICDIVLMWLAWLRLLSVVYLLEFFGGHAIAFHPAPKGCAFNP